MKKNKYIPSVFLLAVSMICVCWLTACKKSEIVKAADEQSVSQTSKEAILSLTAQSLGEECRVNEESAKTNYLNKVLRLTGQIEKTSIDDNGTVFKTCQVTLVPDITCDFSITHKEEVSKLVIGHVINVTGKVALVGAGTANLVGCSIVN
jgi:hypothetical protein